MATYYSDRYPSLAMSTYTSCCYPQQKPMFKISDLFKSRKQKLFEKHVFSDDGSIDFDKEVVQRAVMKLLEKELLALCEEKEKEEKESKKLKE